MNIGGNPYLIKVKKCLFPDGDILAGMIVLFFAAAFLLYPAPIWTMTFYLGVLPVTLHQLLRGERPDWRHPALMLTYALIAWSTVTLVFGEDPGKGRVPKYYLGALFTTIYLSALNIALRRNQHLPRRIASAFIVMGGVNAALSIVLFLVCSSWGERMGGWAETRHPILGALIIIMTYCFTLDRMLREKTNKLMLGLVLALCIVFVVLTQSRGPYLTMLMTSLVVLGSVSWRRRLNIIGLSLLVVAVVGGSAYAFFPDWPTTIFGVLSERGSSHRLDIWRYTLDRVAERPWTGYGPAAYLGMDEFTFPHNLLLSTLFYNGIIGLALFVILLGLAALWLLRQWGKDEQVPLLTALFANVLFGGLTDLGQLTTAPSTIWLILWLPLSLILARAAEKHIILGDKKG